MLASNPSRNSRPELIVDDGQGANLPSRPIAWAGPVGSAMSAKDGFDPGTMPCVAFVRGREAVPWPEFTRSKDTSDR